MDNTAFDFYDSLQKRYEKFFEPGELSRLKRTNSASTNSGSSTLSALTAPRRASEIPQVHYVARVPNDASNNTETTLGMFDCYVNLKWGRGKAELFRRFYWNTSLLLNMILNWKIYWFYVCRKISQVFKFLFMWWYFLSLGRNSRVVQNTRLDST